MLPIKNLKRSLTIIAVCLVAINGASSQSRLITEIERDSIYAKIQRGKINANKVKILDSALFYCDSVKVLKTEIIKTQEIQISNLADVISKDSQIISKLEENVLNERKRGRRRSFWSFLKGTLVGALLISVIGIAI